MEEKDPRPKKIGRFRALDVATNNEGQGLPLYFEREAAKALSTSKGLSIGGKPVNQQNSQRVARSLFEAGVPLQDIMRVPQTDEALKSEFSKYSPAYFRAPAPGNWDILVEGFNNSFKAASDGMELILASTGGIGDAKKAREAQKKINDGVSWGYAYEKMMSEDTGWGTNRGKFWSAIGSGIGQLGTMVAAAKVGAVAGGAAGSVVAPGVGTALGLAGGAVAGIGASIPFMFAGFFDDAVEAGIKENHILPYAYGTSTVLSSIEMLPFGRLVGRLGGKKIINSAASELLGRATSKLSKASITDDILKNINTPDINNVLLGTYKNATNKLRDKAVFMARQGAMSYLEEGISAFSEPYAESLSKIAYDKAYGSGSKGSGMFGETVDDLTSTSKMQEALWGGIVEGILSAAPGTVGAGFTKQYQEGLYGAFALSEANGFSLDEALDSVVNKLESKRGSKIGDTQVTDEMIDASIAYASDVAETYRGMGSSVVDIGARKLVFDRVRENKVLQDRMQSLSDQKSQVEQAIQQNPGDTALYSVNIQDIDKEIDRMSKILSFNTEWLRDYTTKYFDIEKSRAADVSSEVNLAGVKKEAKNISETYKGQAARNKMAEFIREESARYGLAIEEINRQYDEEQDMVVSRNRATPIPDQEINDRASVMIPIDSRGASESFEIVQYANPEDLTSFKYAFSDKDGNLFDIPDTPFYKSRIESVFENKSKFDDVAEAVAAGTPLNEDQQAIFDEFESYITPIAEARKNSVGQEVADAIQASEYSVINDFVSNDPNFAENYAAAIEEISKLKEVLESDEVKTQMEQNPTGITPFVNAIQKRIDTLQERVDVSDSVMSGFEQRDPVVVSDLAQPIFQERMNQVQLVLSQLTNDLANPSENKESIENAKSDLRYLGYNVERVIDVLRAEAKRRNAIRRLLDLENTAKSQDKVKKLMELLAKRRATQAELDTLNAKKRSDQIASYKSWAGSIIDKIIKRKRQQPNQKEREKFDKHILELRKLSPEAADEMQAQWDKIGQKVNSNNVNETLQGDGQDQITEGVGAQNEVPGTGVQQDSGVQPVGDNTQAEAQVQPSDNVPVSEGTGGSTQSSEPVPGAEGGSQDGPQGGAVAPDGGLSVPSTPSVEAGVTPSQISQDLIDRLKQNGLSDDVVLLDSQGIDQALRDSGVDDSVRLQVLAWHGSPYEFKRFSLENIRTGEGTLNEGWGLYFSSSEDVARDYSRLLSEPSPFIVDRAIMSSNLSEIDKLDLQDYSAYLGYDYDKILDRFRSDGKQSVVDFLLNNSAIFNRGDANLYRVILFKGKSPDQYRWMNWSTVNDSSIVSRITHQMQSELFPNSFIDKVEASRTGSDIYEHLIDYYFLNDSPDPAKDASLLLLRSGIDGNKVSIGDSHYNYVVFDDNQISIEDFSVLFFRLKDLGIKLTTNGFIKRSPSGKFIVYLNRDTATDTTLIHEFSHAYISTVKDNNPDLYNKGISLISSAIQNSDPIIEDIRNFIRQTQPDLKGELFQEEVLAEFVSRRSEYLMGNQKQSSPLMSWLSDFWDSIKEIIGLSSMNSSQVANLTLRDYADAVIRDLNSGRDLTQNTNDETNQTSQEGTQGGVLEGVRDGGQETQGGQDGPQLRAEEEVGSEIPDPTPIQDPPEAIQAQQELSLIDEQIAAESELLEANPQDESISDEQIVSEEQSLAQETVQVGVSRLEDKNFQRHIANLERYKQMFPAKASEVDAAILALQEALPPVGNEVSLNGSVFSSVDEVVTPKTKTSVGTKIKYPSLKNIDVEINTGAMVAIVYSRSISTGGKQSLLSNSLKSKDFFDANITLRLDTSAGTVNMIINDKVNPIEIQGLTPTEVLSLVKFKDAKIASSIQSSSEVINEKSGVDPSTPYHGLILSIMTKMPGVKFSVLDDMAWAKNGLAKNARGAFDPNTGTIFLRKGAYNQATVLHEAGHAVVAIVKEKNPELYTKLTSLTKGTIYESFVKNNYGLTDPDAIASEALGQIIEDKGVRLKKQGLASFEKLKKSITNAVAKVFGIKIEGTIDDISLEEFASLVSETLTGSKDPGLLEGYLEGKFSPGIIQEQRTPVRSTLYNKFTLKDHHISTKLQRPSTFYTEIIDMAFSGTATRQEIADALNDMISSGPEAKLSSGLEKYPNPLYERNGNQKANLTILDFLSDPDRFNAIVDDIEFMGISPFPDEAVLSSGLTPSQLRSEINKLSSNFFSWHAATHSRVILDGKEAFVNIDQEAEQNLIRDNMSKVFQPLPPGASAKQIFIHQVTKAINSPFFAKFQDFRTLAQRMGGSDGVLQGIDDLRVKSNDIAGAAQYKITRYLNDVVLPKLEELRKKKGKSYDLLEEVVQGVSVYDNSNGTPELIENSELTLGQLMTVAATIKTQEAYHKAEMKKSFDKSVAYVKNQQIKLRQIDLDTSLSIKDRKNKTEAIRKRIFEAELTQAQLQKKMGLDDWTNFIPKIEEEISRVEARISTTELFKTPDPEDRQKKLARGEKRIAELNSIIDEFLTERPKTYMSDIYYDPAATDNNHGAAKRKNRDGNTIYRGITISDENNGPWLSNFVMQNKGAHKSRNMNILMTSEQIDSLLAMFDQGGEYNEEFDTMMSLWNGKEGREFFRTINKYNKELTGHEVQELDFYFPTRAFGSIKTTERNSGSSVRDIRFLKEREALPGRVIGLDSMALFREYIEANLHFVQNAKVAESVDTYVKNLEQANISNTGDPKIDREIRASFQALKDWHETTRDFLYTRHRANTEAGMMGLSPYWSNVIMGNFAKAVFSFNVGNVLKQVGTMFNLYSVSDIDNKNITKQLGFLAKELPSTYARYFAKDGGPIDQSMGGILEDSELNSIMKEIEGHLDNHGLFGNLVARMFDLSSNTAGVDIDDVHKIGLRDTRQTPLSVAIKGYNSAMDHISSYALEPMRRGDRLIIAAIYKAAKDQVSDLVNSGSLFDSNGNMITDINHIEAIQEIDRLATDLVYKSNNMHAMNDRTPIQNSTSMIIRGLSLFSSQPQKIFNTMTQTLLRSAQSGHQDPYLVDNAMKQFTYGIIIASIYQASVTTLWGIMRNGYDEEKDYRLDISIDFIRTILGMTPNFPITVISGLLTTFDDRSWSDSSVGTPVIFDMASDLIKLSEAMSESMDEEKPAYLRERAMRNFERDGVNMLSRVLGFPVTITSMLMKSIQDQESK